MAEKSLWMQSNVTVSLSVFPGNDLDKKSLEILLRNQYLAWNMMARKLPDGAQ